MTSPAQLDIAYPPTFASSFWTYPDYRTGATILYSRMQDGLDENDSVLALLKHRAETERETARMLAHVPEPTHTADPLFHGASASDRSGIHTSAAPTARTFRLLVSEFATSQADVHFRAAKRMEATIVAPFSEWVEGHADRVQDSYDAVEEALTAMERQSAEVARLRTAYESKCRLADEAEDDARFAPGSHPVTPPRSADEVVNGTRRLSLSARRDEPAPEPASLDPQRLQRRETLRQQFGFKRKEEEKGDKSEDKSEEHAEKSEEHAEKDELAPEETSPGAALQRSSSRISTYLTRAVGKIGDSPTLAQVRATVSGLADPRHIRLRREAEVAEQQYQDGVTTFDNLRCHCEQVLFHQYSLLQRWEADRVTALQRVLSAYNLALAPAAEAYKASTERTQLLPQRLQPAAHLQHLMDEHKTGPFRPAPVVFRPYYHDDLNRVAGSATAGFGMDLVSTAKGTALAAQETSLKTGQPGSALAMPTLPPVLHALLSALQRSYADRARWVPKDGGDVTETAIHAEKRRIWLYDVPLHVTHALRTRLIQHVARQPDAPEFAVPDTLLDAVDAPVLAATVKLWALELDSPLLPYSSWDEVAEIYDAAAIRHEAQGAQADADPTDISKPIVQGISGVLARLPKLHLACLDAVISHLYKLVKDTPTSEDNSVYTAKLGLSLGRAILRPSAERPSTVHAKYPALLVKDLVEQYETLFPPLMHTKAKESDMKALSPFRNVPIRRRSTLVDQRISRSSLLGAGLPSDGLQRRAAQFEQLHGGRSPMKRHTSLSYRPMQGAERAARTSRVASAQVPTSSRVPDALEQVAEQARAAAEEGGLDDQQAAKPVSMQKGAALDAMRAEAVPAVAPAEAPVSKAPAEAALAKAAEAPVSKAPVEAPLATAPVEEPASKAPVEELLVKAPAEAPVADAPAKTKAEASKGPPAEAPKASRAEVPVKPPLPKAPVAKDPVTDAPGAGAPTAPAPAAEAQAAPRPPSASGKNSSVRNAIKAFESSAKDTDPSLATLNSKTEPAASPSDAAAARAPRTSTGVKGPRGPRNASQK